MSEIEYLESIKKCEKEIEAAKKAIAGTDPTNTEAMYKLTNYKMIATQNLAICKLTLEVVRLIRRVSALEKP